jgi:protein gp37
MSDLFHEKVPDEAIERILTATIHAKAHTFQILTKRPERMRSVMQRWTDMNGRPQTNLWMGVSVEDQATADERIPLLLQTPAAVRFVSYEPALGPVEFSFAMPWRMAGPALNKAIDWLIVGGESGPGARPCDVAWIRSTVEECRVAGVACFVKQLGTRPVTYHCAGRDRCTHPDCGPVPLDIRDRKGGDPAEWPEDLRVREMPR